MKRAGLVALQVLGVLVAVLAFVVGSVMLVAQTSWGSHSTSRRPRLRSLSALR